MPTLPEVSRTVIGIIPPDPHSVRLSVAFPSTSFTHAHFVEPARINRNAEGPPGPSASGLAIIIPAPAPKTPPSSLLTCNNAAGFVVPMPTLPLPCWTTNCDVPTVKPCPLASVVVPPVPVNAPLPPPPPRRRRLRLRREASV